MGVFVNTMSKTLVVCKWNPLALQKWLQIFEGVVYLSCVQIVVQHCDLGRQALDDAGRRGGQTLGIP